MPQSFRNERAGTRYFYELAVTEYCAEKGIQASDVERKPSRKLSAEEMGAIVSVFNHEKTVATLQSCIDHVDAIMAIINRGVNPSHIHMMANPFSTYDKTLGYTDPNFVKKEA